MEHILENVVGLRDYKQALSLENVGEYEEAAYFLKETLKEMKE